MEPKILEFLFLMANEIWIHFLPSHRESALRTVHGGCFERQIGHMGATQSWSLSRKLDSHGTENPGIPFSDGK